MNNLRSIRRFHVNLAVLWRSAVNSYRALFAWGNPRAYLLTKVIAPALQIYVFVMMGVSASAGGGLDNADYYVIGNALQTVGLSGLFGVMMSIGSERLMGTLPFLLVTPANRFFLFAGKSVIHIFDGILGVAVSLVFFSLFVPLNIEAHMLPALSLSLIVVSMSVSGLGMLLGGISFLTRDIYLTANFVYWSMVVLCGVNFPVGLLPEWAQLLSYSLPLTRGLEAVRVVLADGPSQTVVSLLTQEFFVGLAYTVVGYLVFLWLERRSKKVGNMETF